jgi:hypothetical protein
VRVTTMDAELEFAIQPSTVIHINVIQFHCVSWYLFFQINWECMTVGEIHCFKPSVTCYTIQNANSHIICRFNSEI